LKDCKKLKYLRNEKNKLGFTYLSNESKNMNKDKECICGSPKRKAQNLCDKCHENLSKCKTITERVEYYLQKIKI